MTNVATITKLRVLFIALILHSVLLTQAGTPVNTTPEGPDATRPARPAADTGRVLPVLDQPILAFMANNNVPGVSLAISHNGRIIYTKGYGFADRESRTRVTPASLFRLASLSKPITSITVMTLVQAHKLSLHGKVFGPKRILGDRYGKKPYRKWVTDITVRFLLQHLDGGWGNSGDDPMFTDPSWTKDHVIERTLDSLPLIHVPGTV